jgi:hypothetical protein
VVSARQPGNAVGWLLLAIAVTIALEFVGDTYVATGSNPGHLGVAWVTEWLSSVWLALSVVFLPLVFPNGRLVSRRWRPVWWFEVVVLVAVVVSFEPGDLALDVSIENPLGVHGAALAVLKATERLILVPVLLGILLAAASLVVRFRRSAGVERQQLKWFAFAALLAIGGLLMSGLGELLTPAWGEPIGGVGWIVFLATCVLGIPLAAGMAILRYRLYDIDVVINRTLVYGSLTAALAATYVASILLLRLVLGPLTGESDLAVAGSTLAVAALFRPARTRIQAVVDRRFYRRRYDAARTLDEFASLLRHEVDLDAVGKDLRAAVGETMQPMSVSLWLREPHR